MNMFKGFWYFIFVVDIGNEPSKIFLNYNRARKYYHSRGNVSKRYYGIHFIRGIENFHINIPDINTEVLHDKPNTIDKWYAKSEL